LEDLGEGEEVHPFVFGFPRGGRKTGRVSKERTLDRRKGEIPRTAKKVFRMGWGIGGKGWLSLGGKGHRMKKGQNRGFIFGEWPRGERRKRRTQDWVLLHSLEVPPK